VYNTAGTYGVDLTASNIAGGDLESKPNYITVNFPYLLDIYPNAAAAYSLRKLRSSYAGNCIRVRRTSDNTELNIGFVNNFLDTATLVSFVGAGSGFLTRFYDQSGNNRDSIQTSAFNQPRIINAGVLYTENGKAAINCYDAIRCSFNITQGGFGGNTILTNVSYAYAFFTGKTAQTNVTRRTMLSIASVNTNSGRFYIASDGISTNTMVTGGRRLDTDALEQTSATTHGSAYSLFTGVADYANAAAYIYKNGVLGGSKVPFQTAGATSNTSSYNYESYIGAGRGDIYGGIENGSVSEVVIYNTDQSSNRAAIETNIKNYFGL
jgi:PKD repeat protein